MNAAVSNSLVLTARAVAAARAVESARTDALFQDAFADVLAGHEGHAFNHDGLTEMIALRTAFIDNFINEQYSEGTRQIVLLGAGMDARAYRMGLKHAHLFELDQNVLFDIKEPLLAQCHAVVQCASRVTVSLDLGSTNLDLVQTLQRHAFNMTKPSCWVIEGLIMYLKPGQVQQLVQQISALSAVRSAIIHDAVSATANKMGIEFCGAKFRSGNDDYAGLWMAIGYAQAHVINWDAISANRQNGQITVDLEMSNASPKLLRGREAVVMVTAQKKTPKANARHQLPRRSLNAASRLQQRKINANPFAALMQADQSDGSNSEDDDDADN